MSSPLALSAVTATLQTCLQHVYNASTLGTVKVSAVAPDLVQSQNGGQDSGMRVNLFLHQVTPNAAWRNVALPSLSSDGSTRLKNPPLALDLHYLLTAYASDDAEAEALLGYAILMLHENPVLPRSLITNVFSHLSSDALNDAIKLSNLDSQIEMIKITPATLGREEMAWLWTALKADYRPTFPFQASVVLMRNDLPTAFSLPVLFPPNITVQPGISAQLFSDLPPNDHAAAAVGNTVTISGAALGAANSLQLANPQTHVIDTIPLNSSNLQATRVNFTVPDDATNMPCGVCLASLLFHDSSGNVTQHTNAVVLPIALTIAASPAPSATTNAGTAHITLSCNPQVVPGQQIYLLLQSQADNSLRVIAADAITTPTTSLSFTASLAAGIYAPRLQVDGVLAQTTSSNSITVPA